MKKPVWVFLAVLLAAPTVFAADAPVWPSGVAAKNDPALIAFYGAQCNQYADRNGLTGKQREAYLTECGSAMQKVFPVGYAPGGGGGGEG
jgi:hypothetical protein